MKEKEVYCSNRAKRTSYLTDNVSNLSLIEFHDARFCIFNAGLFQSLSLSRNAITCLLWGSRWSDRRFFDYLFVMLTLYRFVVVYVLKTDDGKSDNEIVQRRPIRISLRGSGRFKELNKYLSNMNRLLSLKFSSSRLVLLEVAVLP